LRLWLGHGLPQRAIGQSLRLSQGAVHEYLKRAQRAGLGWPLPDGLDDVQLEAMLFRGSASVMGPWSSSSKCIRSPVSCFCPWSTGGRHFMLSEGVAEQSSERGLG
jgi:hypothetical protein